MMKNIVKTMLVALILVACSTAMNAQGSDNQRMSREQMAEAQAKHIAGKLGLDDGTTKKYVETFCDYQKEIWALGPRHHHKKGAEMTDAETEQEIQARFDRSEKILDIRQKYHKRYSQFMTPKQIDRAYQLERETMKRMHKHGKKGGHHGPKGGQHGHGKRNIQ